METQEQQPQQQQQQLEEAASVWSLETLSDDCVFDIFNHLPTNYLYSIAQTCVRLLDLASIQYRRRHPEKYACVSVVNDEIVLEPKEDDVFMFGRKFLNLKIRNNSRNIRFDHQMLEFMLLNCSTNLQTIRFEEVMLQRNQMEVIKHMLNRIETLVLHKCGLNDDFYDTLLINCHRLKNLIVSDSYTIIDPVGNKWLHQKYRHLENVQLCSIPMVSFCHADWEIFFRQNPQIKSFSFDHWYSIDAKDRPIKIISKNAPNLQRLFVSLRGIGHLNSTYYELSVLDQLKQFQRLELQFTGAIGIEYLNLHYKLLSKIRKLHAIHLSDAMITKDTANTIALFLGIKQLNFANTTIDTDSAEILSTKLINLEEIYCDTSLNDFTAFIRNAPRLRKIELPNTEIGQLNLGWGLNWLHDERIKVDGACPITIFVRCITVGDGEVTSLSNGIVSIQKLILDKRTLLKEKNTFVNSLEIN